MLIIRTAQLRAFEQARRNQFRQQLLAHLCSETGMSREAVEQGLDAGVADAAGYGLCHEPHTARFVAITLARAPAYPQQPLPRSALAILMAYGLDATVKLDRYEAWLIAHPGHMEARLD